MNDEIQVRILDVDSVMIGSRFATICLSTEQFKIAEHSDAGGVEGIVNEQYNALRGLKGKLVSIRVIG